MLILFLICFLILFYHILGYLIIISLFGKKENTATTLDSFPSITILCPAYNEVDVIEEKIQSFINLDYPKDKIKMIVISDDSTDGTNEIVEKYAKKGYLELVIQKPRKGKQSGHNLVEPSIITDYILSTDANSIFEKNAVKELLKVMESDSKIGLVSGELKLISSDGEDSGEGIYWKYESFLKKKESQFSTIIGANGSIFLIRRDLFTQIHPASVDDFERVLIVLSKGYLAKYCKNAVVYEEVSKKVKEEFSRKIRIIAQEWHAIFRQKAVFKKPIVAFMLISHKLIRWTFPLYCIGLFISSMFLAENKVFLYVLFGQIIGYLLGIIGAQLDKKNKKVNKIIKLASYFWIMNLVAVMGFVKFIQGKQYATWNTIREEK